MQSKKGGLAAWEPAGAQEWLEVRVIYIYIYIYILMKGIHYLRNYYNQLRL